MTTQTLIATIGWAGVALAIVAMMLDSFITNRTNKTWQDGLVKNGYAEYYLDENNQRRWRMLDARRKPQTTEKNELPPST